jgi:CheY-like chemotaxis protein
VPTACQPVLASQTFVCVSGRLSGDYFRPMNALSILPKVPTIAVIDDDESIRLATSNLVKSLGLCVGTFASAEEFLESPRFDDVSCIISDIQMPGMNGLELQQHLALTGPERPLIFITAFHEELFESRRWRPAPSASSTNLSSHGALSNASRGPSIPSADPDLVQASAGPKALAALAAARSGKGLWCWFTTRAFCEERRSRYVVTVNPFVAAGGGLSDTPKQVAMAR